MKIRPKSLYECIFWPWMNLATRYHLVFKLILMFFLTVYFNATNWIGQSNSTCKERNNISLILLTPHKGMVGDHSFGRVGYSQQIKDITDLPRFPSLAGISLAVCIGCSLCCVYSFSCPTRVGVRSALVISIFYGSDTHGLAEKLQSKIAANTIFLIIYLYLKNPPIHPLRPNIFQVRLNNWRLQFSPLIHQNGWASQNHDGNTLAMESAFVK